MYLVLNGTHLAKYLSCSDAPQISPDFRTLINLKVQLNCNLILTGHLSYLLDASKVTILLNLDVVIKQVS